MKEKLTSFLFIFLIITALKVVYGQNWSNNGPFGSTVTATAIDPVDTSIIYAGTKGNSIYRSTNGGDYWELINNGIPMIEDTIVNSHWWYGNYYRTTRILVSPFHPAHLYAGIARNGLVQSFNHGNEWTLTNSGLPESATVSALWVHPQDSTFLLCGTASPTGGLYKSTDGGLNWTRIDSVPHGNTYGVSTIRHHPGHPDTIYVGITSAGEPGFPWGLMKTPDRGQSWEILNQNLLFYELQIDPNNPQKLWSHVENNFFMSLLFYSNDGGYNWLPYPDLSNFWQEITILYADPDWNMYVFDQQSDSIVLRKSTDHGQTWSSHGAPLVSSAHMAANPLNTQIIYFGAVDAPYRSNDGGQTFLIKENNIINTHIFELDVNRKNTNILYCGGVWGFWKTLDGARNWVRLSSWPILQLASDPQYPDTVYYYYPAGQFKLMRSFDGGQTGEVILQYYNLFVYDIEIHPDSSNIIFVAADYSIRKSEDWGNNWNVTFSAPNEILDIEIFNNDPQVIFFGDAGGDFYKSTDGGESWIKISDLNYVNSIALHPYSLDTIYVSTYNKIMKSSDGGHSFFEIGQSIPSQHKSKVILDTLNPSHVFVGTKDKGVYYSLDAGQSWQRLSGDYDVRITDIDLVSHENRVFLSSHGYGVWRGDNVLVNIDEEENEPLIPQQIQLFPAYPNPFNQSVTIPFRIKKTQTIKLSVYDIQGKLINQLMKRELNAGYHQVRWDGRNEEGLPVASGIYIIRLQSRVHSLAGKVLLLK